MSSSEYGPKLIPHLIGFRQLVSFPALIVGHTGVKNQVSCGVENLIECKLCVSFICSIDGIFNLIDQNFNRLIQVTLLTRSTLVFTWISSYNFSARYTKMIQEFKHGDMCKSHIFICRRRQILTEFLILYPQLFIRRTHYVPLCALS